MEPRCRICGWDEVYDPFFGGCVHFAWQYRRYLRRQNAKHWPHIRAAFEAIIALLVNPPKKVFRFDLELHAR